MRSPPTGGSGCACDAAASSSTVRGSAKDSLPIDSYRSSAMRDASARGPLDPLHDDSVAAGGAGDPIESRNELPGTADAGGEPTDVTDPRGIDEPTDAIDVVVPANES